MSNNLNVLSFEKVNQEAVSKQKDNAMLKLKERMQIRKVATEKSSREVEHEQGMSL